MPLNITTKIKRMLVLDASEAFDKVECSILADFLIARNLCAVNARLIKNM